MIPSCAPLFCLALICFAHSGTVVTKNDASQQPATTLPDAPSQTRTTASSTNSKAIAPPGTQAPKARLSLLSSVTSKLPSGASFLARLEDPVQMEGKVLLPQGSVVEGHLETVHASRMLRPGALHLVFDRIKLPDGTTRRADLVVVGSDSDSARVDDEGTLHPTISKKRLAFQLGGAAAMAKLADDIAEEALAAGASSARYYGLAGAGVFLLVQKGREVKLREGDIIEAELLRDPRRE